LATIRTAAFGEPAQAKQRDSSHAEAENPKRPVAILPVHHADDRHERDKEDAAHQ